MDMIFLARQLQEKCREQQRDLYLVFIDLTKAFSSVSREVLWTVLSKFGCPSKLTNIIRAFHGGIYAQIIDNGDFSEPFPVVSGTKQKCVLAPLLFNIFYTAMLIVAFRSNSLGIDVQYRSDDGVFNLCRLAAKSKTAEQLIRDLLYADE